MVVLTVFGISSQFVNDHTLKNCTVNFASQPFNLPAKSAVWTSCGFVNLNAHWKNGLNLGKMTEMNEALHSGKPVDIKVTGFLVSSAYEITVSK